jgi:hypothetical protein
VILAISIPIRPIIADYGCSVLLLRRYYSSRRERIAGVERHLVNDSMVETHFLLGPQSLALEMDLLTPGPKTRLNIADR